MKDLTIRKAVISDLDRIMDIFDKARTFMRKSGNPTQWADGYPQQELIVKEIECGHCHVCCTTDGKDVATFCLVEGPDPTYSNIYDGRWIDDKPYHVVHRLASDGSVKGAGRFCMEWCLARCASLRVDTHADNRPMQDLALHCGFIQCGRIRVENGSWRIAYQHVADNEKGRIRTVCRQDAKAIADIYNGYVTQSTATFDTEAQSTEEMEKLIQHVSETYPFIVYEEGGKVLGFCYAHLWKARSAYRQTLETTIYLSPAQRGKGIGMKLMHVLMEKCRKLGFHALIACITGDNHESIAMHQKLGFKQVSCFKEVGIKFGRRLDVVDYEFLL